MSNVGKFGLFKSRYAAPSVEEITRDTPQFYWVRSSDRRRDELRDKSDAYALFDTKEAAVARHAEVAAVYAHHKQIVRDAERTADDARTAMRQAIDRAARGEQP